jgi:hypothetical protein
MTIFLNLNFINFYFYIVIGGETELVVTVKNAKQYNLILRRDRIKTNSNGTSENNTSYKVNVEIWKKSKIEKNFNKEKSLI